MSKNFELLHSISNEKELFQTLDVREDLPETAAEDAEPTPETDEKKPGRTPWQTGLPDVLQTVRQTLGPLGPLVPDPVRRSTPGGEPIAGSGDGETQNTTFGDRFPISRNPITRLNSAPLMPTWAEPKIGPEAAADKDFAAAPEPEALRSIVVPEALPSAEKGRISGFNDATIEERRPVKEEKTSQEAPHAQKGSRKVSHQEPPAGTWINGTKLSSKALGSKVQARGIYKDARRELIAREEELKLVQRVFLGAEQDSPRIALFSGLEFEGGCAAICARTGEILASQAEGTVCLVDADFRASSLHEYFGVRNEKGLAEATFESGPIQQFAQQLSRANLWLIPSGYGASQLNLAETADRLRARMEEVRRAYRYVIVHSGPLGLNASAMTFSKWTDGVVLILEANRTRRDTARRIRESLGVANAKVLGVVLNNRSYPIPESIYGRL
jgi:Mrp family chromosome partitioning ATPase